MTGRRNVQSLETPLHVATRQRNTEIVRLLLEFRPQSSASDCESDVLRTGKQRCTAARKEVNS